MAWALPGKGAPKVAVAIPLKGTVSGEWATAFAQMIKATSVEMNIYLNGHFELDYARNDLVDMAKKDGCTHLFFLDGDVLPFMWNGKKLEPYPTVIEYMLYQEYPIVTGVYWTKRGYPNIGLMTDNQFAPKMLTGKLEDIVGRHLYVDVFGTGCCLIDMRVFDKVAYPWFLYYRPNERNAEGAWDEVSEDFYFGYKAKRAGFLTLALGELMCKHEGRVFHTWSGDAEAHLLT